MFKLLLQFAQFFGLLRSFSAKSYTLQTDGTTPEIDFFVFAGGLVHIVGAITSLTFWASDKEGGTFSQVVLADTFTVEQGKAYTLPIEIFGAGMLKIRANAAGIVLLTLKS